MRQALRVVSLSLVLTTTLSCASSTASVASARTRRTQPVEAIALDLAIPAPTEQYVHVEMRVPALRTKTTRIAMPAWTPGSYLIRDFARHVYDLDVRDAAGQPLPVRRIDKQTWEIEHDRAPFVVRYRVFADELSVRTSHVDDTHALINGASVFFYLVGDLDRPYDVTATVPSDWRGYTALTATSVDPNRPSWHAEGYDELVDSPIEFGTPRVDTFAIDKTKFEYVFSAPRGTNANVDRLVRDGHDVVAALGSMMGGLPMRRYVFLVAALDGDTGGLEHADSTVMLLRKSAYTTDEAYLKTARLTAHEFFHAWNVKRIHDQVLGPFDYAKENYTRLLWFHEGFTDTMAELALLRAGIVDAKKYLERQAKRFGEYRKRVGRNYAPVSELSFESWIKQYKPAKNHPHVAVSYYDKGHWIGLALDLEIRSRAARRGRSGSLEGMFRRLWNGRDDVAITFESIVAAASAEAGEDLDWFFAHYVNGTHEIPLVELLAKFGVRVTWHHPWQDREGSSKPRDLVADRLTQIDVGIRFDDLVVASVRPESPAATANFMNGDRLVAVAGIEVHDEQDVRDRLARHEFGQYVPVHVFRGNALLELSLPVKKSSERIYTFELVPTNQLSREVVALRDGWLASRPRQQPEPQSKADAR